MPNPTGSFIWYELMTTDPDAAKVFYDAVVGWTVGAESVSPGQDYRMIGRSDGGNAGGVLKLGADMLRHGANPVWLGYMHTPDVDAAVAAIKADGGRTEMPAMDIPQGRLAMVTDPQGAPFYLMNPTPPPGMEGVSSDVFSVDQPQRIRWNELASSDPDSAVAFYINHFGWAQEGDMDMGPMGKYRFIQHDGVRIGAIMGGSSSLWRYYIGVDDIDRAIAAIKAGGGKIEAGPHEIPGGEYSLHGTDPQGATFGLVGPRNS